MGLNETPSSERTHIGFFGCINAGKSSVVNAVTGQSLAVVSEIRGTTTDPVKKAMELLPLGPVVIIDTPGMDDTGELGELRVQKTKEILSQIHAAVIVVDAVKGLTQKEKNLIETLKKENISYIVAYNKSDLLSFRKDLGKEEIYVSAKTGENIELLKEKLALLVKDKETEKYLVADLLSPGDHVVLVVPIDKAAPKGRLILPQQQTIRDILDAGSSVSVCRDSELKETLSLLKQEPKLVITDSQVFNKVKDMVPEQIMLTSFSILFARYKGNLSSTVKGAVTLQSLKDGDKVLILEGCTHHRQCGDIGTQKLPAWIQKFTQKELVFEFTSGGDFPQELSEYALIIHCGACMLNEKQMQSRIARAEERKIPMTNYGIVIAYMNGILERSVAPFMTVQELPIGHHD